MVNYVIYDVEGGIHTLSGIANDIIQDGMWFLSFAGNERVFCIPVNHIAYANVYIVDEEEDAGSDYKTRAAKTSMDLAAFS